MQRHWSFIVTDKKYLVPVAVVVLLAGLVLSYVRHDAMHFARAGNFVVCIGAWMSMRGTLREGLKRVHDARDSSPVYPDGRLNANWFNARIFAQGDAVLSLWGFAIVFVGSVVWAYGDLLLKWLSPASFI
jgi:hypothetical protein